MCACACVRVCVGVLVCLCICACRPELFAKLVRMINPILNLAARVLLEGRRLVYLLPVFPSQATMGLWHCTDKTKVASLLPKHPRMRLVGCYRLRCFTHSMARIIVVMQKGPAIYPAC